MTDTDFCQNLRLLASYGQSTSEICRRLKMNRQQFNKYVNGHAMPSLSTLRKLCDFFGVDEHEILMPAEEFKQLLIIRPPQFGTEETPYSKTVNNLLNLEKSDKDMLSRHEGFYFSYTVLDPKEQLYLRALSRIYRQEDKWMVKTIERGMDEKFMLPATVKYSGVIVESSKRIAIHEKQITHGHSLHTSFLYSSEEGRPNFLTGLQMGILTVGSQEIQCVRTVWDFLGSDIDLRKALKNCGVIDANKVKVPDYVIDGTDNQLAPGDIYLTPNY
ncbi:helix-turn-helix domain-containing protein [Curvivirga sp.]|uniref:helix-turn-helix domain-containing protein n=1 Tax=Curvivirga sp. TaxID=2856848 RepID=UPI003B58F6F3